MILTKSIKGRLLLWIFLSVATLFVLLGFSLHNKFKEVVFESVDRTLHSKLQLVKGLMHEDGNDIEFELDEIVLGEYAIPRSGHYYQIIVDGRVAAASVSLVKEDFNLTSGPPESFNEITKEWIYVTVGPAEEPLRVIRHDFAFLDKSITILVADSITESLAMINRITSYFFIIMPLMIILVGIVSFLIASASLRPLKVFSSSIEKITHKTLNERIEKGRQALELQGLAETFNSLLTRLQVAFESEKHLIADAAHELKTPLAVISAQCDICLQKKRTSKGYVDSLTEIKSVSKAMLRQINGMLTLTRLDSGMLSASTFRKISLHNCIEDAIRLVEPLAKNKTIKINKEFCEGMTVLGDQDTLTEALVNIIENAVRYNVNDGAVDVATGIKGNQAVITITDTGIGIREDETARIFDRFYRSEATRGTEGTGLGLSIARAVIQAHHGDIGIKSEVSRGSRFIITIPLQDTKQG